jgi:ribosomal protein L37E
VNQKIIALFSICLLLSILSCNNSSGSRKSSETEESVSEDEDYLSDEDGYKDGTYCAEVEYYNPSTGTRSTYDLDVEVDGGELTIIHWPNSGWLDDSHFYPEDITNGECEFTSDRGYQYVVTLGEFGGCGYTDENKIRRDVNKEVEATTCPKCGDQKDAYDDYCSSCKRKIEDEEENTCNRCGGYEYGVYGGLCSNCKQEDENF